MEEKLVVEKAYLNDSGRGIARIDPKKFLELDIIPGDIIEIEGKKCTSAKAWRLEMRDWDKDIIRIDGFIRQNSGTVIGERIKISKPEVKIAEKLVLALPEGPPIQFGEVDDNFLKRQIMRRSINKGDIIPVISTMAHPFLGRVVRGLPTPLIAVDTTPEGIIMIDEDTEINLIMDETESYIYSLLGLDKLEKDTSYNHEELHELLGEKNFKLLLKLHGTFNKLLYPS